MDDFLPLDLKHNVRLLGIKSIKCSLAELKHVSVGKYGLH